VPSTPYWTVFKLRPLKASIFDEGHMLKNLYGQRYRCLIRYSSRWRLLVTGTPVQNNLEELVVCQYPLMNAASKSPSQSLMNFILCDYFGHEMRPLHAIFKAKDGSKSCALADERVDRARKIISPFLLRRLKKQVSTLLTSQLTKFIFDHKVEKGLPNKKERIEWCELTGLQRHIYDISLRR